MKLCDGKYEFYMDGPSLACLRYGKKWRDFVGDKATHALYDHALELEAKIKKLLKALEDAVDSLEYVDRAHPGTVTGSGVRYDRVVAARSVIKECHDGV